MNIIKNIKVTYKIMILVIIAALGLAAVGYRGYGTISQSVVTLTSIYQNNMQQIYHIGEAKYMMRDMQSRAVLALDAKTPERFKELNNDTAEILAKFDDNWAAYEKAAANEENLSAKSSEVKQEWKNFTGIMKQIIDVAASGRHDEAASLYSSKGGKATSDLRKVLETRQEEVQHDAELMYTASVNAASSAAFFMLVYSVAALIILLLGGLLIIKGIVQPLGMMMADCRKMQEGDFSPQELTIDQTDEFGDMAKVMADMRSSLSQLMSSVHMSAEQIAASSEELSASSQQSAQASNQVAQSVTDAAGAVANQQQSVDSATTAVEKVSSSINNINNKANLVSERSSSASHYAADGAKAVQETISQIQGAAGNVQESAAIVEKLGERSNEIGDIVATISGIAEQTNLLALNAAIEAARAGEHGRGFAVVAEEVRKLAEQSGEAAQKIANLIAGIQKDTSSAVVSIQEGRDVVSNGAQSVDSLRDVFEHIQTLVMEVNEAAMSMTDSIHEANEDSSNIADQIVSIDSQGELVSNEMQTVSAATEEQAASATEIADASEALSRLAADLQNSLQKFRF